MLFVVRGHNSLFVAPNAGLNYPPNVEPKSYHSLTISLTFRAQDCRWRQQKFVVAVGRNNAEANKMLVVVRGYSSLL